MSKGLEDIFAFDLCDNTGSGAGTMWLGGDGFASTAQYTPLVPNDPFYRIDVDGLSLGGTIVASDASSVFQQPILDTGTSLFFVPSAVYNAFVSALTSSAGFTTVFGSNQFSQFQGYMCVNGSNVTDAQVESELPAITLSLPNVVSGQPDVAIQAPALDTYIANAGGGEYCLTITPGGSPPSVFGVAFMQAFRVVIDLQDSRAGFAPQTTCPAPAGLNPIVHRSKNGPSAPRLPRSP